jgi:hypothetical protein
MVEPLAGWRHVEVTEQRTMQDYAKIARWLIDEVYPQAEYIRLVQDNLNTHMPASLYETFPPAEARCMPQRLQDEATLRQRVLAVETERNEQRRGIDWQFTRARCPTQAGAPVSYEKKLIGLPLKVANLFRKENYVRSKSKSAGLPRRGPRFRDYSTRGQPLHWPCA